MFTRTTLFFPRSKRENYKPPCTQMRGRVLLWAIFLASNEEVKFFFPFLHFAFTYVRILTRNGEGAQCMKTNFGLTSHIHLLLSTAIQNVLHAPPPRLLLLCINNSRSAAATIDDNVGRTLGQSIMVSPTPMLSRPTTISGGGGRGNQ